MSGPTDEFKQGIVYACAVLVEAFNQPTMAENILREGGCVPADGLPYDRRILVRAGIRDRAPNGDPDTIVPAPASHKRRPS